MSFNEPTRFGDHYQGDMPQYGSDVSQIENGWDVFGADGEKVGDVAEVNSDYITVSKGFLFTSERYIPVSAITQIADDRVYLNVTKDEIEASGWDQVPQTGTMTEPTGMDYGRSAETTELDQDTMHVPVTEEELRVRRRQTDEAPVRVHKDVVEEEEAVDVPLREERVNVQRHRVDRSVDADVPTDAFQEQDIEIPVRGEEAEVSKEAVVREHVDISKTAGERTKRVSDTVRREDVHVEGAEDTGDRGTRGPSH